MREKLYLLVATFVLSVPLAAQAPPSAGAGEGISVWVGASVFTFNPDYGCGATGASNSNPFSCWDHHLVGVGPYVDTNSFLFGKIGFEGEARLGLWHGPATLIENTYLGGPRVKIFHYRQVYFNGKFLLGHGHMDVPDHLIGQGGYFVYAPGLAIDFPVGNHVAARVEYEY